MFWFLSSKKFQNIFGEHIYISVIKVKYKTFEGEKSLNGFDLFDHRQSVYIIQVPVIDSDDDQTLRIIILTAFYLKVLYIWRSLKFSRYF